MKCEFCEDENELASVKIDEGEEVFICPECKINLLERRIE